MTDIPSPGRRGMTRVIDFREMSQGIGNETMIETFAVIETVITIVENLDDKAGTVKDR
jgi:hypothetical protein